MKLFIVYVFLAHNMIQAAGSKCEENARYRTYDGSCNNLKNPTWGQAHTAQRRFETIDGHVMVAYEDNEDAPRGGYPRGADDHYAITSPRLITNLLMNEKLSYDSQSDRRLTGQHYAYGQLFAHDVVKTKLNRGFQCCNESSDDYINGDVCFPYYVPNGDHDLTPGCNNFNRAVRATSDNVADKELPEYREQINEITSYVDASFLYGSSIKELERLRDNKYPYLLKTNPGNLLPENSKGRCRKKATGDYCQDAGDSRVDTNPSLALNHLLFVREHNRLATQLRDINPDWSDEKVFEETRRIVVAEVQHITYNEYLSAILDHETMEWYMLYSQKHGHFDCYDEKTDASIRNSFAAAALRVGHSQVTDDQSLLHSDYVTVDKKSLLDNFLNPHLTQSEHGKNLPNMARWFTFTPANKIDIFPADVLRNHLFGSKRDLFAFNIHRGRDQGIPSYNKWRKFCGLPPKSWEDFHSKETTLRRLYHSVDDIDLFVGGLLEKSEIGGVGQTFACIFGKQFLAWKCGDRYWYERPDPVFGFSEDQLNSIKKITMSKLFCENFGLEMIQRDAFLLPKRGTYKRLVYCDQIPDIDLYLWSESNKPRPSRKSSVLQNKIVVNRKTPYYDGIFRDHYRYSRRRYSRRRYSRRY